jgi:hypothetical protein
MPLIGGPGAVCNNIEIATAGSLSMPPLSSTLNVFGNFKNDGSFLQGLGTVEFSGNSLSDIGGNSAINFYNLKQSNSVGIQLLRAVNVKNVLTLNGGYLNLNAKTLTVENSAVSAIVRNDGYVSSENSLNLSKVTWKIGSAAGQHKFPFGKPGYYLPFTMDLTAGTIGDVTVSTYGSAPNNTAYPTTPEAVASSSFISYTDNVNNVVDRFWQIDKNGASGTANVTFSYADNEIPNNGEAGLKAFRYSNAVSKWQKLSNTQTQNLVSNAVTIAGVSTFSPWTLILPTSPLPIELVSLDVKEQDGNAVIFWAINHNPNVLRYTIERSNDGFSFDSVGFVNAINLSGMQNFSFTDTQIIKGIHYYRIKWEYAGGLVKYSKLESININNTHNYFEVSCTHAEEIHLFLNQDNDEPLEVEFFNALGNRIATETIYPEGGKSNTTIDLSGSLSSGIYLVTASNSNNSYQRTIVIK